MKKVAQNYKYLPFKLVVRATDAFFRGLRVFVRNLFWLAKGSRDFTLTYGMKRFLYQAAIWLARIAAVLVVVVILFYAEEDWRGARDWAACQRELAAKGESLDLRQLVPPGKPEDDLSKVPIFAEVYQRPPIHYIGLIPQDTQKPTRLDHIDIHLGSEDYDKIPKRLSNQKREPFDLVAWQKFYRSLPQAHLADPKATPAQDVLHALSQFDPEMNEVQVALSNPKAYWPINYERPFSTPLGAITSMIRVAQVLPLRAAAHLENNETDLAEKDYLFSFQIQRSLADNGFPVSYLVMLGVRAIDDGILWEGLHRHAWSGTQLQDMESALASTDLLSLAARTLRTERAFSLQTMKMTQAHDPTLYQDLEDAGTGDAWYFLLSRPGGWWDQDRCRLSLGIQQAIDAIKLQQQTLDDHPFNLPPESERTSWGMFYNPISQVVLPNYRGFGLKIAHAEINRRLARLACRLEEYRIAHGQYPDALDALPDLPAHLNQEVLSEAPLRYSRKGDGYLLYSVGWDQKDDGGVLDPNHDDHKGDWVWPSP